MLGSVQRTFASASDRGRRRVRPRRRPPDAREGLRRRRRGVQPGEPPARRRRRRARNARGSRPRRRPRGSSGTSPPARLRGAARSGRRRGRARAATPRSCRSPRWSRWPPRCRPWRRAPAGSPRPCRRRASTRRATSTALAERLTALFRRRRGRASARSPPPARAAPPKSSRQRLARRLRSETSDPRLGCDHHGPSRPPALARPRRVQRGIRPRRRHHEEGHLGPRGDRRRVAVPRLQGARRRHLPDDAQVGRGREPRAAGRQGRRRPVLRVAGRDRHRDRRGQERGPAGRADRHRHAAWSKQTGDFATFIQRRRQALQERAPVEHLGRPVQGRRRASTPRSSTAPTSSSRPRPSSTR